MSTVDVRSRHRVTGRLGVAGAALGVVAGVVQAAAGSRIPSWTGNKQSTLGLGLLTVALSLLAGAAAVRQSRPALRTAARAACALGLVTPGLLCFSTVGRLWYLPGTLLVLAGAACIDSLRDTAALVATSWLRCLLGLLGAAEVLMAAGAAPLPLVVGAVGGIALVAAASLAPARRTFALLVLAGTVPFAVLAWAAVVPVVLLLAAAAIATSVAPPASGLPRSAL